MSTLNFQTIVTTKMKRRQVFLFVKHLERYLHENFIKASELHHFKKRNIKRILKLLFKANRVSVGRKDLKIIIRFFLDYDLENISNKNIKKIYKEFTAKNIFAIFSIFLNNLKNIFINILSLIKVVFARFAFFGFDKSIERAKLCIFNE